MNKGKGMKSVAVTLSKEVWEEAQKLAEQENRALANFVRHLLLVKLKESGNGKSSESKES